MLKHSLIFIPIFFLLLLPFTFAQESERSVLQIGFYGEANQPAAKGLQLAIAQINTEIEAGQLPSNHTWELVISQNPRDLAASRAVFTLPPIPSTSSNAQNWEMPVFLLSSDAPLELPGIQAPIFRALTPQAQLDEMRFRFMTQDSNARRILLLGDEIGILNLAARLQSETTLEFQHQPETLLTSANFQEILTFNPQFIIYGGDAASAYALSQSLSERDWSGYFLYDDLPGLFDLPNFAIPQGVRYLDVSIWLSSRSDELSLGFVSTFSTEFEATPTVEALAAYDLMWALQLVVQRNDTSNAAQLAGLFSNTNLIRTTLGEINPLAYGGREVFHVGLIYEWISPTERNVLMRYDGGNVVGVVAEVAAFPTPTLIPSPTPSYYVFTVTSDIADLRTGPSRDYFRVGELVQGESVQILGELINGSWYLVLSPYGPAWTPISRGSVYAPAGVQLPKIDPPPPPTPTPSPTSEFTPVPIPVQDVAVNVAPLPANNPNFELGGQVVTQNVADLMHNVGMTWLKEQVRWERGETADKAARGAIEAAHASGFKILISSVGHKREMGNFDQYIEEYAAYLAEVARLNPDAIEVWNEPNIDIEWPAANMDGRDYTRMLQRAYATIKAVNPNVMVISAAPAPTGFFRGRCTPQGCDDDFWIQQMAGAGAANSMDCIGIHYNEGLVSPDQRSGDPRGSHHSYYLPAMIDLYTSTFGNGLPLCFTEMGYLAAQGYGGLSPSFAWAQTITPVIQGERFSTAIRMGRSDRRIRMIVIWNVNFRTMSPVAPFEAYALIRTDGSCPACEFIRDALR